MCIYICIFDNVSLKTYLIKEKIGRLNFVPKPLVYKDSLENKQMGDFTIPKINHGKFSFVAEYGVFQEYIYYKNK